MLEDKVSREGFLFDIKRYSIHDGPGIRTTFFLKGCPLSCWWCHNPEGISPQPVLFRHPKRCIGCGRCVAVCPTKSWSMTEGGALVHNKWTCALCGKCADGCPSGAIEMAGFKMSPSDLLKEAKKDVPFFDESGGGVTFSGGEPLLQRSFVLAALLLLENEEIHRAIDTSGYCPEQALTSVASHTDLFLFDIKHVDQGKHEYYTGVSNDIILSNLKKLDLALAKAGKGKINIRIPLIPGINDDEKNIIATARIASSLKTLCGVNVLPYHATGEGKYGNLQMENKMSGFQPPTEEKMDEVLQIFRVHGISAVKGG